MKTVIVMLNSKFIHSSLAPWYLRAGAEGFCSELTPVVFEGTVNEDEEKLLSRLLAENADVYAFCCYIWNINRVKSLAKRLPGTIIFGGPEVSYNAEEILCECQYVDYVLSGEGDITFPMLLSYLDGGAIKKSDIAGLCYRENGENVISMPYISNKQPPSPYCKEYFDTLNGRITYIEASRGCPFSCAFCLSGRIGKVVFFDIERIKNEIIALANSGTQTVKFIDRTFNADENRANEILQFIIDSYEKEIPKGVTFHFEIDGGTLKNRTIEILKTAPKGLFQLEVGLQSYNEDTLKAIHRNPKTARLEEVMKTLISFGNMHIHADLIAGLPNEDYDSFRQSFNRLYEVGPHMLQLGFLKLLHGSELREKCKGFDCEFSAMAPYEVRSTKSLSAEDIKKIHLAENALDKLYNSQRFKMSIDFLIKECIIEPFDLFLEFGEYTNGKDYSLDDYLTCFYDYFSKRVDSSRLRDILILDRISTNSSGFIPKCLQVSDKRLKQLKKHIAENLKVTGKFSCAILYSFGYAVYCSYNKKNPVTENYKINEINLNEVF